MIEAKHTEAQVKNIERFFEASEELFEQYGYKKTTIQDICKAAALSKPTFYDLFKDKAEFFAALLIHISEKLILKWERELPDGITPVQMLLAFIDLYIDEITEIQLFRIVFENPEVMERFAWIIYHTSHSPVMTALQDILDDGVKSLQFRHLDPETAVFIIYSILDSMFFLLPMQTKNKEAAKDEKLISEIKQFILNGVGANNGGK